MDELREEIKKALLNKADQRDSEAQRYGNNVHLSENLKGKGDGLKEYSKHYNCLEVDQWFWSLFGDKVVLPRPEVVQGSADYIPGNFKFRVKVPNSITLICAENY